MMMTTLSKWWLKEPEDLKIYQWIWDHHFGQRTMKYWRKSDQKKSWYLIMPSLTQQKNGLWRMKDTRLMLLTPYFCLTNLNIYTCSFFSEQLFEYAGYYLDRETFQSMRAGELESVIVDVWCLRLNQLDLNRGLDKPKRIFFSTQAFVSKQHFFYVMPDVF